MTFLFKNGTSDKRGVAKVASTTLRLCLEKPVLENYGMAVYHFRKCVAEPDGLEFLMFML